MFPFSSLSSFSSFSLLSAPFPSLRIKPPPTARTTPKQNVPSGKKCHKQSSKYLSHKRRLTFKILENKIEEATSPRQSEVDFGVCLEICDLVNQKGKNWPRDAAIAIVRRVNSPYQQQALLSMSVSFSF
jgi:hypothetical protein